MVNYKWIKINLNESRKTDSIKNMHINIWMKLKWYLNKNEKDINRNILFFPAPLQRMVWACSVCWMRRVFDKESTNSPVLVKLLLCSYIASLIIISVQLQTSELSPTQQRWGPKSAKAHLAKVKQPYIYRSRRWTSLLLVISPVKRSGNNEDQNFALLVFIML